MVQGGSAVESSITLPPPPHTHWHGPVLLFQCSLTCGKGVHTRTVKCVRDDSSRQQVAESQCQAASKPEATEACVNAVCSPDISE